MLLLNTLVLPVLLPVVLGAVGKLRERDDSACTEVHLFLARGNGEAYPGRVGQIANTVCDGLSSCDSENILFDSSLSYCAQASDGVSSGLAQIAAYSSRCPNAKLVLAGYSLGAQIVGDILGGGGGTFYNCVENTSTGLSRSSSAGSQIAVVLIFGDVRHVANEPYNVGSGSGDNGQYPRTGTSLSDLNEYSGIMQSYCLSSDPICALGNDGYSHTTYMTVYADTAGAYAQKILGVGGSASSVAAESTTTSTSSASATSSTSETTTSDSASTSTSFSIAALGTATLSSSTSESTSSASASSSGEDSGASASSSPSTTSTSEQASITSSAEVTASPSSYQESYSYSSVTPFVFSNTATVATTSTYFPSTVTSTSISSLSSTTPTSSSSSSPTSSAVEVISSGGASSNGAQLTLSLVTLVVLKVLAF